MVNPDAIRQIVLAMGTVNGVYQDVEHLPTSGYFSVVFKARRVGNDAKTILKFFADPTNTTYRRLAFEREGSLLWGPLRGEDRFVQLVDPPASLAFPVPLPGGGQLDLLLPFLAFEYMNGGSAEKLANTPIRTSRDVLGRVDCFREMTRSVARLHRLRCFHRDLKPGNFLFENIPQCRRVLLSDFGTIRFCDGSPPLSNEYTDPVGDIRYSAPELFSGVDIPEEWHRAADLYSLGAIFFELLTGYQLIATTFGDATRALSFSQHMKVFPEASRLGMLHKFLDSHGHRLPRIRTLEPAIPKCVAPQIDELLAELTEFDYRRRVIDLDRVGNQLKICMLVLANETRYLERLQRRRAARGSI